MDLWCQRPKNRSEFFLLSFQTKVIRIHWESIHYRSKLSRDVLEEHLIAMIDGKLFRWMRLMINCCLKNRGLSTEEGEKKPFKRSVNIKKRCMI